MINVNKLWEFIFKRDQPYQTVASQPFLHELIKDEEYTEDRFREFSDKDYYFDMDESISKNYDKHLKGEQIRENFVFIEGPQLSQLHIINLHYLFGREESQYYAHLVSRRVMDLGYRIEIQDVKSFLKEKNVHTYYKYFLKPDQKGETFNTSSKKKQLFGNIIIELRLINDRPESLSMLLKKFMDSYHQKPLSFTDFLIKVFYK